MREDDEELIAKVGGLRAALQVNDSWWISRRLVVGDTIVGCESARYERSQDGTFVSVETIRDVDVANGVVTGRRVLAGIPPLGDFDAKLVRVDLDARRVDTIFDDLCRTLKVSDGAIAFTYRGWLAAFDAEMDLRWTKELGARVSAMHVVDREIAVVQMDAGLSAFRPATGEEIWRRDFGAGRCTTTDSGRLYAVGHESSVEVIDGTTGQLISTFDAKCPRPSVRDWAWAAAGMIFYGASVERGIRVLSQSTGELLQVLALPAGFSLGAAPSLVRCGRQLLLTLSQEHISQRGRIFGLLVIEKCGDGEVTVEPRPQHRIETFPTAKGRFGVSIALRTDRRHDLMRYSQVLLQDAVWTYGRTAYTKGDPRFDGTIRLAVACAGEKAAAEAVRLELPDLTLGMNAMGASAPGRGNRPLAINVVDLGPGVL